MTKREATEILLQAINEGNLDQIREALDNGADPNSPNVEKNGTHRLSALRFALLNGDIGILQCLIQAGARADLEPDPDDSVVHLAAENGNVPLLKRLLSVGGQAKLNTFDYVARTPLMCAIGKGHIEVVRFLIQAGADLNAQDEEHIGNTALHIAAEHGSIEMVDLLLDHGADPMAPGFMWLSPYDKAQKRSDANGPKILARLKEVIDREGLKQRLPSIGEWGARPRKLR